MEKYNIKNIIVNLFRFVVENEKKIIMQRNRLKQLYCFDNNFGYFKYIDIKGKKYIHYDDLVNFLFRENIHFKQCILRQVMKNYDNDGDHYWNFEEFDGFVNNDNSVCFANGYISDYIKANDEMDEVGNYAKELAVLFKYEIEYIESAGIKIKSVKEIGDSKGILNSKAIYEMIKGSKKEIDVNAVVDFMGKGNWNINGYYNRGNSLNEEEAKMIIKRISNDRKSKIIKYSKLDEFLKYDKYISDEETNYERSKGYYKSNPVRDGNILYFSHYYNK